ncbi:MAG: TRAP transporter large permease [Burkholderiaceae bacterium]|nr:TRAP transporter large permease [Burkholderiaceae bacterium]
MQTLLLILIVAAMIMLRQSIPLVLLVAAAYVHMAWGDGNLTYLVEDIWYAVDNDLLLAIPMFLLAGSTMTRGSIAQRLIDVIRVATQWLPGGLGVATILSCAVFAAISGSSPVTMLAIGSILYPALLREGYDKRFALGAVASAGTLGIIIPPSIPMILFGIVNERSIVDLFIAGMIPGLLLTAVLAGYSLYRNRHLPAKSVSGKEMFAALKRGIWAMLLPVILLGGIYSGYFSPTESAAVALGYAVLVELVVHREMKLRDFYQVGVDTAKMLGTLVPIVAVSLSLQKLLTVNGAQQALAEWVLTMVDSKIAFLLAVNVLLLIVGCFVDVVSATLVLSPLLLAPAIHYGIDPIHFGIIMVINLEIGFLTPPVGLNLIVAMSAFKENFLLICRSVVPFVLLMVAVLMVITFVPWLSLVLIR